MADKSKGFIKLYRSLQDHWVWNAESFSKGQAWVDLLLSVNHETKKIMINGRLIVIKAGQMWTSYDKLATRWRWSKDKVARFAKTLQLDGMIYADATPNGTLLTLVNYSDFVGQRDTDKATNKATDKDTDKATDKDDRKATDKATDKAQTRNERNIKNDKEIKKIPRFTRDPVEDY